VEQGRRPFDFEREGEAHLLGVRLGPGSRPIPNLPPRRFRSAEGRLLPRLAHLRSRYTRIRGSSAADA
jgi:hypothetical protein